jgi:hypothetical protein
MAQSFRYEACYCLTIPDVRTEAFGNGKYLQFQCFKSDATEHTDQ